MLGNGRLEALCFDGEKRLAHIRGKLRKKVWINQGDIILLSLRDYQDEKGDVILKYSADEARSLKAYGELPETAKINETDTYVPAFFALGKEMLTYRILGMVMRVWMTMLSSTKIGTTAVMKRILMLMRYERARWCMHAGVRTVAFLWWCHTLKAYATRPVLVMTTSEAWFEEKVAYRTGTGMIFGFSKIHGLFHFAVHLTTLCWIQMLKDF